MTGPLETEQQARELPAVRAVYAAFDADHGPGKMTPHNHRMLLEALTAAGVELGTYDLRILLWLAGWEPQTCAVVAGWITRAAEPGVVLTAEDMATLGKALADAIEWRQPSGGRCADCEAQYGGLCADHAGDELLAYAYVTLGRKLGIEVPS